MRSNMRASLAESELRHQLTDVGIGTRSGSTPPTPHASLGGGGGGGAGGAGGVFTSLGGGGHHRVAADDADDDDGPGGGRHGGGGVALSQRTNPYAVSSHPDRQSAFWHGGDAGRQ